jgi:hypothetical protein
MKGTKEAAEEAGSGEKNSMALAFWHSAWHRGVKPGAYAYGEGAVKAGGGDSAVAINAASKALKIIAMNVRKRRKYMAWEAVALNSMLIIMRLKNMKAHGPPDGRPGSDRRRRNGALPALGKLR